MSYQFTENEATQLTRITHENRQRHLTCLNKLIDRYGVPNTIKLCYKENGHSLTMFTDYEHFTQLVDGEYGLIETYEKQIFSENGNRIKLKSLEWDLAHGTIEYDFDKIKANGRNYLRLKTYLSGFYKIGIPEVISINTKKSSN
ncbi:MAG: hypothetical protein V1870_03135 [Candidatus Aenigmatarchaeota archaeon]